MKRNEYVKFVQSGKSRGKSALITGASITDPTYARTGRQLIFQPLNIEYRMKYPDGVPLNPDNPMEFNEFDKIYPDTFKSIRQANEQIATTKTKLNEFKQNQKKQPQPQPQPINPNN